MREVPLIYLIAGEESGDTLAHSLIAALKRLYPGKIDFAGVGGARMIAHGLDPLFPMSELSVMGLVEVLAHLPQLIRRIEQTVADILEKKPDIVIGIDAPDFCFRVEKRVRAADPSIRLMHYVAPSVWAWRPGRARKIAAFLDHLLALLPFEPPYFETEGLNCSFVGHPAVEGGNRGDAARFRAAHGLAQTDRVVLLLPGSRTGEVSRLLPLCVAVAEGLAKQSCDLFFVFPTVPHVASLLRQGLTGFALPHAVIESQADKGDAFAAARAALAASGTVALELALAGVPTVICYRVTRLSAFIARRLVRIAYAALPNLILNREIMPEFLQERATVPLIAPALAALLDDTPARERQLEASKEIAARLKPQGKDPSVHAAEIVLELLSDPAEAED